MAEFPDRERLQPASLEEEDRSKVINTVLDAWKTQAAEERKMRKRYAAALVAALFLQIIAVNTAFFMIGNEFLKVDEWTARTFIAAVFTELAAMVFFIVKYLFSRDATVVAEIMKVLRKDE